MSLANLYRTDKASNYCENYIKLYMLYYACRKFENIRMSVFWPRREFVVLISRCCRFKSHPR